MRSCYLLWGLGYRVGCIGIELGVIRVGISVVCIRGGGRKGGWDLVVKGFGFFVEELGLFFVVRF